MVSMHGSSCELWSSKLFSRNWMNVSFFLEQTFFRRILEFAITARIILEQRISSKKYFLLDNTASLKRSFLQIFFGPTSHDREQK